jgi:hypothetical protein
MVRSRIEKARAALAKLHHLSAPQRRELSSTVEKAEAALAHYEQLSQRGQTRRHASGTLYAAGATLLFDDVSGLGTIDDALLPLIALGLLAVHLATQPPVAAPELDHAWNSVITALNEAGQVASQIAAAGRSKSRPARHNCRENMIRCLGTPLGNRGTGRSPRHSICADCLEICQGTGMWPEFGHDGKDCRWWEHE